MAMLWVGALVFAMFVAGCGGSSESVDTTLTVSSLSKAQFIQKANVICYAGKGQQAREYVKYEQLHPNLPRFNIGTEAIGTIFIPSVESQLVEVRELGAPAGEAGRIEAFWGGLERSLSVIKEEGLSAATAIRHAFMPNGRRIYDYGLDGCAYGL